MEQLENIINGHNGFAIIIAAVFLYIVTIILGKLGFLSFKGKGLKIGKSEEETRALLIKQKDFVIKYCNSKLETILLDASRNGKELEYFKIDYVMEKMIDNVLGWLLFNNVSTDKDYIELKTQESEMVVFKAISKVNHELLKDKKMQEYFKGICKTFTEDILNGLMKIKKIEGFN